LSAIRGEGGVVVLGGEAGMGKSRLVRELAHRAERLGCAVMSGTCSEAELSLPYLPFLEGIGNYLTRQDVPAVRERLGPAAAELGQLFPQMGHAGPVTADPMMSKLRLFEAIVLLLTDAARSRGLLAVVEDLHWADPATRELVDYATRRLRSTKVMMLATYRTDEMHRKHALLPSIQTWRRSGQAQLMEVEVLSAASAIGLTFDVATLAAVAGKPEAAVAVALESCVTNQLLEEADRAAGRYCFRHALTREAVYEDIVATRRQQLHARIAEVL